MSAAPSTSVAEVAPRIFRLSTFIPDAVPGGLTFNQFLVDADEPLLFHTGMRAIFNSVRAAAHRVVDAKNLRWISFGHVEADENGAMNLWLEAAPRAQVLHGELGCMISLNDLADRAPRALADGETLDLGGRRVRLIATPHVPHAWESIVLFEETTRTLLCGDLFTHAGDGPAVVTADIAGPAIELEKAFPGATALTPRTGATLRRLADLLPATLAPMHGSSFRGDGAAQLRKLADGYDRLFEDACKLR